MAHETTVDSNAMITPKRSLRFKIGVFLLIVNTPIGYGGSALAAAIGLKTHHPALGAGIALGYLHPFLEHAGSWNMDGRSGGIETCQGSAQELVQNQESTVRHCK